MKKLIIFLTIIISTIFSNEAFADIMVPWDNCHNYDKTCYEKCLKNWKYKEHWSFSEKWRCKDECCIKEKKYCTNKLCTCMLKWNAWPMCKFDSECKWDCTEWNIKNISKYKTFILILFILITWIFIYKRKKSKKW